MGADVGQHDGGEGAVMKYGEFQIGTEFWSAERPHFKWRCTDVGTRVVVAIQLCEPLEVFDGPATNWLESVFNEDELEHCTLERGVDSENALILPGKVVVEGSEMPDASTVPEQLGMFA